jgi:DNA-binding NarL/FixJ family response regulator
MRDILLVDDLPEALHLLEKTVRAAFPAAFCTRANGVKEALAACQRLSFDLALVDLHLGDGHGVEVINHLSQQQPTCTVVVATIFDDDEHLFRALQAGAHGYVLKDRDPQWLQGQLLGIAEGQPPLSPAIARRLIQHFHAGMPGLSQPLRRYAGPQDPSLDLTAREREVLGQLAQGVHIQEIARQLGLSRHTVGDHVKNLYRKLNISSRAEAALHARSLGLV